MVKIPDNLKDCIKGHKKFIIAAHKQPDADTLTSAISLALFLRRLGKEAFLVTEGPFSRVETTHLESYFLNRDLTDDEKKDSIVVYVDCNAPDRIGVIYDQTKDLPVLIIDHHATESDFGNCKWIDARYAATTLMIYDIIRDFGEVPTIEEAELLFLGFSTDTGFFRHLDSGTDMAIQRAAELVSYGASPKKTFSVMTGGKTLSSRKLMARIIDRIEEHYDGKILISWEDINDRIELKATDRDSDTLYQAMLSINGVEAVAVIRQESTNRCTVGLRSVKNVDVRKLAETFGGGGHQRASGFATEGELKDIKNEVIKRFKNFL